MPIIDTRQIAVVEKLPGWRGRLFQSPSLTFGHWDFAAGSSIHAHRHPQEEVWEILEGEVEIASDGRRGRGRRAGVVAIVPANVTHAVRLCPMARPSPWTTHCAPIFDAPWAVEHHFNS